ncbi:MAG: heavy metal translocating P-type ATPase [Thermodesulfobacteriota bacterium]
MIFEVCHAIPGRLRLKISPRRGEAELVQALQGRLLAQKAIFGAEWRPQSRSLVIRYYPGKIDQKELLVQASEFFAEKGITLPSRQDGRESLGGGMAHFLGLTVCMGYVFIKKILLKQAIAQGPLSLLGLVAGLSSLATLKSGLTAGKQKPGISLETFIGGAALVAVGAGEALAALEVLWIEKGSHLLTDYLADRSQRQIREMFSTAGEKAYIHHEGVEVEVPCDTLQVGDEVIVHTGERIPVDGEVIHGEALVDTSHITGQAQPERKSAGDPVFAGTYIRKGVIAIRAERVGEALYLRQVLKLAEEALGNRAAVQKVADKLGERMLRTGLLATAATYLLTASFAKTFAVMLTMACPCATALAAGSAISAGLYTAMDKGILIKGGRYLEEVGTADTFCFDKTGTITPRRPEVSLVIGENGVQGETLLQWAVSAEQHNKHPIAAAIKQEAHRQGIQPLPHAVCDYTLGEGVRAEVQGQQVLVGNERFLRKERVQLAPALELAAGKAEAQGQTVVYVALEDTVIGLIGINNHLQRGAVGMIAALQADGVRKTVLITGDKAEVAHKVLNHLPFDAHFSSLLPEDKARVVNELKENGHKVVVVGDGVNDALALAQADIGIAMGAGGSEIALATADIVLTNGDLGKLVYLRELSQQTLKIVHQNFWLALSTDLLGAGLGLLGFLPPVLAGMFHIVHSLGIMANSGRLLTFAGQWDRTKREAKGEGNRLDSRPLLPPVTFQEQV